MAPFSDFSSAILEGNLTLYGPHLGVLGHGLSDFKSFSFILFGFQCYFRSGQMTLLGHSAILTRLR